MSDASDMENLLKRCCPARYVFAFLANIGLAIFYGPKVNLSVTRPREDQGKASCFTQIPLARVAEVMSAKWVLFFSVAANTICTLLTLALTKLHYGGLICMRVIEGIGGGALFPAMHIMIVNWPQAERLLITSLIYVCKARMLKNIKM